MIKPHDIDADIWATLTSAEAGDATQLRQLIARNPRLARCEYWYTPPIHFAVRGGHAEAVQVLLDGGADPEYNHYHCCSLVEMARYRGYDDVARLLEQARDRRGRLAPQPDHAIHIAAKTNDAKRIRELLDENPALIHRGGKCGCSPLLRAVVCGGIESVQVLLDRGADVHAFHGTSPGARGGWWAQDVQALDLAIWGGPPGLGPPRATHRHQEIARLLLDHGAEYTLVAAAARGDRGRILQILDANPDAIREEPRNGRGLLSAGVEFGHDEIVRLLLERGADPNQPELGSSTGGALQRAAGAGKLELVQLLLEHGADPASYVDSGGNATWAARTPEIRALLKAHGGKIPPADLIYIADDDEVMRALEEDPEAADPGSLFTTACTNGRRDLVNRLQQAGFEVPEVLTGCQTYVMDDPEIFATLVGVGSNPDHPNWQRQTLLHRLAGGAQEGESRLKCATLLLDAGASLTARDDEYRSTPLAWAARAGIQEMVELLLSRSASIELPDDEPWATPLAWAQRHGQERIEELLRSRESTI